MAIKVGVIGLGMMGGTHLDVYAKRDDVEVVAISDLDPGRLSGEARAKGNVEGQAQGGLDYAGIDKYPEGMDLIAQADVDVIDICLPTPLHLAFTRAALEKGRHVLSEKPVARTYEDAKALADLAGAHHDQVVMIAMCMRFWPGWDWLKDAVDAGRYGKVLGATFQRVSSFPGGPFYADGAQSGGALLDLHVHDTDFIKHCFGMPKSVTSFGYSKITSEIDHLLTRYEYDQIPLVIAEGCWAMADGYGFNMKYHVNFENASASFDLSRPSPLMLCQDGKNQPVELEPGMGYDREIDYFLHCVSTGRKPEIVTVADAAQSIRIAEAEKESILTGRPVVLTI